MQEIAHIADVVDVDAGGACAEKGEGMGRKVQTESFSRQCCAMHTKYYKGLHASSKECFKARGGYIHCTAI